MRTVRQERARVADTPADAVRDVELVMYSLSNDQAVEEVVFGAKGILSGIKEGQIAMDMSTVLPATSLREQEAYAKRGVDFLDAPVFGSKQESADAKLWIMAAGNKAIFEKVKPVLEQLGANRSLLWQERKCRGHEAGGKPHRGVGIGSARGRPGPRAKGRA
jgi:3-hydroxyisobutyrate dehydrogenase-like beta-hydroxyacid dehydrogenase